MLSAAHAAKVGGVMPGNARTTVPACNAVYHLISVTTAEVASVATRCGAMPERARMTAMTASAEHRQTSVSVVVPVRVLLVPAIGSVIPVSAGTTARAWNAVFPQVCTSVAGPVRVVPGAMKEPVKMTAAPLNVEQPRTAYRAAPAGLAGTAILEYAKTTAPDWNVVCLLFLV